MTGEFLKGWKR